MAPATPTVFLHDSQNLSAPQGNLTFTCSEKYTDYSNFTFSVPIAAVFFLLSLICNAFTLFILRGGDASNLTEGLLLKLLAFVDMISAAGTLLRSARDFMRYSYAVPVIQIVTVTIYFINLGAVVIISGCRYLMILKPLRYHLWVTKSKVTIALALVVVVAIIHSLTLHALCAYGQSLYTVVATAPVMAGIGVTMAMSSHVGHISVKHARQIRVQCVPAFESEPARCRDTPNPQHPAKQVRDRVNLKGVKTLLLIDASFAVAWLPWIVYVFKWQTCKWIRPVATFTTSLNSCWNVLIYYFTNRSFRAATTTFFRNISRRY